MLIIFLSDVTASIRGPDTTASGSWCGSEGTPHKMMMFIQIFSSSLDFLFYLAVYMVTLLINYILMIAEGRLGHKGMSSG